MAKQLIEYLKDFQYAWGKKTQSNLESGLYDRATATKASRHLNNTWERMPD